MAYHLDESIERRVQIRFHLAVLAATAACRPADPPLDAEGTRVRIATFNVRRFFDTTCDSQQCFPGDYEEVPTEAQFAARATQIANAVREIDADVIALQEIETQGCLDALGLSNAVLGEIGDHASVDVAVISKTPIERVDRHRDEYTFFARELLEVHVRIADQPVVLVAAHFKSKANDDPLRRLAEAQASSRVVLDIAAREPTALVVLAGDLNDTPGSPTLDALSGLVRVADDLPPSYQVTYVYNGDGQAIDHILQAPTDGARRIPFSTRTWSDGNGYAGSDHAVLSSEFTLVE